MASYCITLEDVQQASRRIKGIAHRTPVLTCQSFNKSTGAHQRRIFFKVEAFQRTGSFKFRGALNAIRSALEDEHDHSEEKTSLLHVVTHSSGNHAAAIALAARLASADDITQNANTSSDNRSGSEWPRIKATIVMPDNAPTNKVMAVQDFGGQIVVSASTPLAREEACDNLLQQLQDDADQKVLFVHPSENPKVIAGQGTVSLELIAQVQDMLPPGASLDAVIIPVGGGGLASGNTIALRGMLGSNVKIILAEPELLDDAKRSFVAGSLLGHDAGEAAEERIRRSVADGLKTTLGPNTWPIVRDLVDDIITVSELDILRATKLVWERLKVCIEPSAGVGVAVLQSAEFQQKYPTLENIAVILCGGNVDLLKVSKIMEQVGLD